jgi:hypothetical protein
VGSKEVDKYVFVVGGCDDIAEMHPTNRKFPTAFEIDPDIVTGYNIHGLLTLCTSTSVRRDIQRPNMLEMGRIEPNATSETRKVYVEHASAR